MSEHTDITLLLLTLLSVYTGWARGFCNEITRFAAYLFSGVIAYALVPVLQPFVPNLNNPRAEQTIALVVGAFVVCYILRLSVKPFVNSVKSSNFNDLDRTGGALYGLIRGGAFILIVAVGVAVIAPHGLNNSKILNAAYGKARPFVLNVAGIDMKEYAEKTDAVYWKTNLLNFMQDSKITTEAGESSLLAYLCAFAAQEQERQTGQKVSQEQCRMGFQAYLSSSSQEELAEKLAQQMLTAQEAAEDDNEQDERTEERDLQNTGS